MPTTHRRNAQAEASQGNFQESLKVGSKRALSANEWLAHKANLRAIKNELKRTERERLKLHHKLQRISRIICSK